EGLDVAGGAKRPELFIHNPHVPPLWFAQSALATATLEAHVFVYGFKTIADNHLLDFIGEISRSEAVEELCSRPGKLWDYAVSDPRSESRYAQRVGSAT